MLEITKESQASPSLGAKLSKMRLNEEKICQMDRQTNCTYTKYRIEVFYYLLEDILTSAMSIRK